MEVRRTVIKTIILALTLAAGAFVIRSDDPCGQAFSDSYPAIHQGCKALLKRASLSLHSPIAGESEQRERRVSVINVANAAELSAALTRAVGGDVIRLAAGDYGAVRLSALKPQGLVTITSADTAAPAHLNSLVVTGSENFAFRNLDIGRALNTGEGDYTRMAEVRSSTRIIFDHVNIHSSVDGDYNNDGYGIFASKVNGLVITGSKFTDLTKGLVLEQMENLQIDNNSFVDMRSDGINVAASKNVLIDANTFQGFHPTSYDHGDAIQFYNLGQPYGSSDIVIRNNVLLPGGTGPQGIWLANPDPGGYTNVTIENNLLWGDGLYNGIGVSGAKGLKVIGNTVVSPTNDSKSFWIRLMNSSDVVMTGNLTDDVIPPVNVTNLKESNNTILSKDSAARALLPNLNAPTGPADLITPGKGYQLTPSTTDKAPVSDAIGGSLGNKVASVSGALASKVALTDHDDAQSSGTIHLGSFLSAAPAAAPQVHAAEAPAHLPPVMSMHNYMGFEHFVALA